MKFGIRTPSLSKRIAARTSFPRFVRHSLGFKAPRGFGWFTNPRRAAYNRIYSRTTFKADNLIVLALMAVFAVLYAIISGFVALFASLSRRDTLASGAVERCPRCNSEMVLRYGRRGKFYGCSRFPNCRGTRNFVQP